MAEKGEKAQKAQKAKKSIIILLIGVIIMLVIGSVFLFLRFHRQPEEAGFPFGNRQGNMGNFEMTEGVVAVSGVTSAGIIEESFPVENLTTAPVIEEVYISSEGTVTEGDKVLKLSEASVAAARKELNQELKKAELAYRTGVIEYEQNKITAEYERDSKLLKGEQAKAVYEEAIARLQDNVDSAEKALTDAKEQISEYQSYVNDNSYREYFELDKYQNIYDTNLEAIVMKLEEWNISWSQITGQGGGGGNPNSMGSGMSGEDAEHIASTDEVRTLSSLYRILEENLKDLEQAQSDYDNAVANAGFQLQTLELQLPGLEQALAEAKEKYEIQTLQAKLTYETSLANAESAESRYEAAISQAESDYKSLKDDWEDAGENLELFESCVGDGYFYASGSGTVLRLPVRAGQGLASWDIIFLYSNPEKMTVTVSVDQADISSIALGDSVYIQSSGHGSFAGVVTEVDPISGSGSRTSVTYHVTAAFTGDTGELPANESVTVIFGMEERRAPQTPADGGV